MDDIRGDFSGPPHGTTPAAVLANKTYTKFCTFDKSGIFVTKSVRYINTAYLTVYIRGGFEKFEEKCCQIFNCHGKFTFSVVN